MSDDRHRNDDRAPRAAAQTTMHVQGAVRGDADSLSWVIERLSPLLLAYAEYRVGTRLRRQVEPQDLVNEAWVVALPRLATLTPRDGRMTPVLLRFLTTTIMRRIARWTRRKGGVLPPLEDEVRGDEDAPGIPTRVHVSDIRDRVLRCLDELRAPDREIILLRGIEQRPAREIAGLLGISEAAAFQRYSRALKRLRAALPESVFDELLE